MIPNALLNPTAIAAKPIRTDPETVREVWRAAEVMAAAECDIEIVERCRVRTAYRLVREMLRTLSLMHAHDAVSSLGIDKFLMPQQPGPCPPTGGFPVRAYAAVMETIEAPARFGNTAETPQHERGIPIVPTKHLANKSLLDAFRRAYTHVATFLHIEDTDYGRIGLTGLLDDPPIGWPDADVLYVYEGMLLDEILTLLVEGRTVGDKRVGGTHGVEKHLTGPDHGMMPHEARGLVKLAKFEARSRMEAEIEEDRAIMAMRLENLVERARETFDTRVELGALKQLSIVQGVTRAEPEDAMSEFANVVRRVANEARQVPERPPVENLPE